jgi:glycosyltransferase involved in cell wall biosynthesis
MKIAIFHNYMDNIGGAEIVTLTLARELNADIYSTNIDFEKIEKMGFSEVIPRIYSIGTIPKKAPFRQQLAFWKFRKLDLGKRYDFYIIAGDWAMSGAVNNKPNLWYAHSPLNELWQFREDIRNNMLSAPKRLPYDLWVMINRALTLRYAHHVENWVCNSANTQQRIKRYYKKDARIIYPPIDTERYSCQPSKGYWLSVNRLTAAKRINIQIEAFAKMPQEKLIIVGSYEKGVKQFEDIRHSLETTKTQNIEMRSWVSDDELKKLYAECRGFITTAKDEDFGMTAVEAMASGKPVIAPSEGGYTESIIHNSTGIFIPSIHSEELIEAVQHINHTLASDPEHYVTACLNQAKRFDTSVFIESIKEFIKHSPTL